MICRILEWPHPELEVRSWPVGPGPKTDALIQDMFDTMKAAGGVGLAAAQIGVPLRLFVLDVGTGPEAYLNPEWTPWKGTDEVMLDEGCLSVPNPAWEGTRDDEEKYRHRYYQTLVPRFERINASWMDRFGAQREGKLRGLRAQAFQHEHEHLEGRIFVDHLDEKRRNELREALAKR